MPAPSEWSRPCPGTCAAAAVVFWLLTTRAAGPYDPSAPTSAQHWVKHLGYTVVGPWSWRHRSSVRTALSRVLRWGR